MILNNESHYDYGIDDNIMLTILRYQKFTHNINYRNTLILR